MSIEQERKNAAPAVGRKQWIAIAIVLAVGLAVGALILRTGGPSKPAGGHAESAAHADEEHHESGKEAAGHGHDHEEAKGHADGEHHEEEGKGEKKAEAGDDGHGHGAKEQAKGEAKGDAKAEPKAAAGGHEGEDRRIAFTEAQIKAAGVAIETTGPANIRTALQLPGEIRFNEDRTAHVVPRVPGVVDSVPANLGQEVKRGQVLAVISSPALSEQRSELQSAQRRLELARSTYEREKKLWEEKISPQQDYLQAQQLMQEAQIAVANANQKLLALGAVPGSGGGSLGRYELRAPFDGLVVEKHISLGESVKEDANVFTVSDLSTVWAEISVPAQHLPLVRTGETVRIRSTAFDQVAQGKVSYVGALLGAQTRTATARVTLTNPQRVWRPGLFVNVELVASELQAPVTVSAEAVQSVEDKPTVFLRVPGGFLPQAVQTGRSDGQRIEITGGLKPGQAYAAAGSFVVKSQQGKASATHTH
ncbi:membrane fusion protein, cobalt-zinc-cadmium efflux system [Variovorax sp. PDC80]|uniref:efflux RND transporter periplasmic adaptor subunit n=1 Tax=Variovorax sp. PDC80 TaxID=1882827 RepID=UPI0008EDB760|nr:efflux RND transporter periplasmic adaptor subunit [Variovorax sp. PDC80]SFN96301.1 membrane fusion protein, cobalt-zinc-cadmium efflux system [Variovorax sp. PDC80]